MPSSLACEMMDAVKKVGFKLLQEKKGEGLNLVVNIGEVSGQLVPHLHIHIIPRKKDDGLHAVA